MDWNNVLTAFLWLALIGGVLGILLAVASKIFAVKKDEKAEKITSVLPGANCGGCGYPGCSGYAEAISKGKADINKCGTGGAAVAAKISEITGIEAAPSVRMRAQVMCSGTPGISKHKYNYSGPADCYSAARLGGGDKICPNGCIGLGTCVSKCPFGAIKLVNGVAAVDYKKCRGCGVCVNACPKQIIRLIPFDSKYWVGCMSVDKGAVTRSYCDTGCIACRLCESSCEHHAIKINDFVASIDYSLCVGCGKCVEKCPRGIIKTGTV